MKKIAFVVMPFGSGNEYPGKKEEADFIYNEIIRPAVNEAVSKHKSQYGDRVEHELEVVRELENVALGMIPANIVRHLAEAHIAIIDLTGRNPNVFLELGARFALRRNGTILLVQNIDQIPFNVHTFRVVQYSPHFGGIEQSKQDLSATVLATLDILAQGTPPTTDSLVFDALPNLKISGLGFTEEAPVTGRVSWEEYWTRTAVIEDTLNELQATGAYKPDLLVGISNGGLFLADTSLRLVYRNDVPLISLWAQRSRDKYFDNAINNALISSDLLRQLFPEHGSGKKIRILVMDDIVGTQRTFNQLVEYFKERLGDTFQKVELRFIFLFTPRQEAIDALRPYLLSQDTTIVSRFKNVELEVVTGKSDLPYRKSIHYGDITQPLNQVTSGGTTPHN